VATIRFARIVRNPDDPENRADARNLLKVSVMYLPLLMAALMLNAQGKFHF
jgi:protoheme IX farnesyltransferase